MTVFSERNGKTILNSAADADGDLLTVTKINGQAGLVGMPVALSVGGSITVTSDGIATFDDTGFTVPEIGEHLADGIIVTISDGQEEIETSVNLELFGAAAAGAAVFGAKTLPFEGGIDAPAGATAIVSGDPNSHFAISNGMLLPTLAGSGNLSGAYSLAFDTGDVLDVVALPDTFSISKDEELDSLLNDSAQPADGFKIRLRPGQYGMHTLRSQTFVSGFTLEADDSDTRLRQLLIYKCWGNPEIVVQGINFTSETPETSSTNRLHYLSNPTPNGILRVLNCKFSGHSEIDADPSIWYAKLDYTGATAVPVAGERIDNDNGGDAGAYTQILEVHDNGDGSGTLYVSDNPGKTNGGSSDNQGIAWAVAQTITSDGGWTATLSSDFYGGDTTLGNGVEGVHAFDEMYVEGCSFTRLDQAIEVAATHDIVVRGNVATKLKGDFVKIHCPTGLPPTNQTLVERNLLSKGLTGVADYTNPHSDGIQLSGNTLTKDWEHMVLRDNIFFTGASDRAPARTNTLQPFFLETKSPNEFGLRGAQIVNNIADSGVGTNAIVLDYAYSCVIENNLAIPSLQRSLPNDLGSVKILIGKNGTDLNNQITGNVTEFLDGYGNDETGNTVTEKYFDFSAYFPNWNGIQDFSDVTRLLEIFSPGAGTPVMAGSTWQSASDHGCVTEAGRFIGHDGTDLTQHFLDLEDLYTTTSFVAPTNEPAAFAETDWALDDSQTGGTLTLTITTLPYNGGVDITDLQVSVDGAAYTSLGTTDIGSHTLEGLSNDTLVSVQLRALNAIGVGPASDVKQATPTELALDESFSAVEPSFARIVYDRNKMHGGTSASVPIALTGAAPDSAMQGRVIDSDDTIVTAWEDIGTTDGTGNLSGQLNAVPPSLKYYRWQVRKTTSPSEGGTTTGQFGVGDVIGVIGQSNLDLSFQQDTTPRTFSGPECVTLVTGADTVEHRAITTEAPFNDSFSYVSDMVGATSDAVLMVVDLALSGQGRRAMVDDSDTGRSWADDAARVDHVRAAGSEIGCLLEFYSSDDGPLLSTDALNNFLPYYAGVDTAGSKVDYGSQVNGNYTLDHSLYDLSGDGRGLFDESRTKMVLQTPWGRSLSTGLRSYLTDLDGIVGTTNRDLFRIRDNMDELLADPHMAGLVAQVGPYPINIVMEANGTGHPERYMELGRAQMLRHVVSSSYLAMGVYADDYSTAPSGVPQIIGETWTSTHVDVEVFVPSGRALTTTALARGMGSIGTAQPWHTEVMGFNFAQSELHDLLPSGFEAVIHDAAAGIIRITPDTGTISPGARLAYATGPAVPVYDVADKGLTEYYVPIVTTGAGGNNEGLPVLANYTAIHTSNKPAAVRAPAGLGIEATQQNTVGSAFGSAMTFEFMGALDYTNDTIDLFTLTGSKMEISINRNGFLRFIVKGAAGSTVFSEDSLPGLIHFGWQPGTGRLVHLVASYDFAAGTANAWLKNDAGIFDEIITASFTTTETELSSGRKYKFGDRSMDPLIAEVQRMAAYVGYTSTGDVSGLTPYLVKAADAASFNSTTNTGSGGDFAAMTDLVTDV